MSVIIRLQNLPWSANALDIRQYFHGLSIPEGGVHIVGGEQGDAFIAFSTDEDARQAFNRNHGKIKEIQINLNLSSRTEMQRVIESARTQSYAAFMQPTPLPAAVPPIVPAAVPEIKKEDSNREIKDKRDRKRSRSKSRDRKDRSSRERDRRDRRHRERSRSRSRDRRERRRRDRSRSRGRTRSKERDRRGRDGNKRADDRNLINFNKDVKVKPEVWATNSNEAIALNPQPPNLLGALFSAKLDIEAKQNLNKMLNGPQVNAGNGFMPNNFNNNGNRNSWPPQNFQNNLNQSQGNSFQQNRPDFNNPFLGGNLQGPPRGGPMQNQNNFQNRGFPRNNNFHQINDNSFEEDGEDEDVEPMESNTCVQLEPFYGGYGDVRRFFQGVFISNKGIKFINDEFGHRTGIVFIQCGHRQGKLEALSKNGEILNGIKVDVSHLDENEFERAVDRFTPDEYNNDSDESKDVIGQQKFKSRNITKYFNQTTPAEPEIKNFSCLIVDDLPTYVKEQDILHMFSLHPLFSLILTTKPKGGHIAYVKFSNAEVAKTALEEKSHHVVGGKQVSVRPCKDEEFDTINKQHEVDLGEKQVTDIGTDCLNLCRLPQKTNDRDIADFFSDIGVIPSKIHLVNNKVGFTGQVLCEFENNHEASRACKKDDTVLGNATISVKPIARQEMQNILGHTLPIKLTPPIPKVPLERPPRPFMQNMNRPLMMPHHQRPFLNRNNFDNFPRGGPRFGPRGGGPRPRFCPPPHMNMNGGDEAPPGCTVFMDNVPYKAGTNEILDFFEGYDVTNNVSRRYNPNNTPSAEAKVIFHNPDEAYRAVQERNGGTIWDRPIYLKQA